VASKGCDFTGEVQSPRARKARPYRETRGADESGVRGGHAEGCGQ
jgi:hypothetical protein